MEAETVRPKHALNPSVLRVTALADMVKRLLGKEGYYRNFGIRAVPSRVHVILTEAIEDGAIDWSETEWHGVGPTSHEREIRTRITAVAPRSQSASGTR